MLARKRFREVSLNVNELTTCLDVREGGVEILRRQVWTSGGIDGDSTYDAGIVWILRGVVMATGGWFNHYDDPDEFWDEEPLTRPQATRSAQTHTHTGSTV